MKLTIWDLFKYIFKHKFFIAAMTVLAYLLSKLYVNKIQTYSAEVIISYNDSCISTGYALDGSKFDVSEIVSPKVIASAKAELPFKISDDGIKANTKITPIIPDSEKNIKEAKEKLGEEYEYHANVFKIRYKGNASYYETRDTLDKLIDNYFKYYNEKYLYLATVSEIDYNLNNTDYDYIEQAEIIQNNVDNAINVLEGYANGKEYRSPSTGLTFKDLINEFEYLSEFKLPTVFSRIYDARLTFNKELLINKYTDRMETNELQSKNSEEKSELAGDRMKAYVKANVDVPNSYNSNHSNGDDNVRIIDDIDHHDYRYIQEQTTYDSLIKNYVTDKISANVNKIDAKHCKDVIKIFSTPAAAWINYENTEAQVKKDISDILTELKELYNTAFLLIDDYNSYIPAQHIECLTGIRHYENVYSSLYHLIALILGFGLSCILAIAIEIMRKYAAYSKSNPDDGDEASESGSDASGKNAD